MNKIILTLLFTSALALGTYAEKKPGAEKPAKAEKSKKGKKAKGEEVSVVGAMKCAHCDFKIGDSCVAVLKTEKKFKGNESRLYFLKGKVAKTFAKENPKAEKVEASGLAFAPGSADEHFVLKVAKIAIKE